MIKFTKIRWCNFLSTGNQFTEIDLNRSPSTLIVGENGAGKSTMLDAILFALYGKPYRNINKPQLLNSITGKGLLVEIEFLVKGKHYLIRRGMKPNVFEIICDGKLLDQNASIKEYQEYLEKNILKLNHKSFTQIVVVGSANFVPFMQLKPQDRRQVIEDLLDIEIFTKMFNVLKDHIAENKTLITDTKHDIEMFQQKIELTRKHMNEIRSLKQTDRVEKEKRLLDCQKKVEETNSKIETINKIIQVAMDDISDHGKIQTKLKKLENLEIQLNNKIKTIDKEISFFEDNDECPTCQQDLDSQFVEKRLEKQKFKKEEVADGLEGLQSHFSEVNERLAQISSVQNEINNAQKKIMELNAELRSLNNQIVEIKTSLNEELPQDEVDLEELQQYEAELENSRITYKGLLAQREVHEISASLLKEGGIKSKIIKQYVPIINKLMNKYLAAMEFFVQFELDENFNEKIKSRFRDEFTYESFSEGEKMRIDLSLLFTWRAVAKLRNSISTNLLIMDEVFDSSLDTTGTDEFLKIITSLNNDTNTFVISHKGDQLFDKFHSVIKFEKIKNFSQMAA